jgi:DhnA family fructose-bisphosphate aldolase class Ia
MIALDHGAHNEYALLEKIEDFESVLDRILAALPDCILLTPGQARRMQRRRQDMMPGLVLRCDVTNVYTPLATKARYCHLIGDPVEEAIRLDAAAVLVNLFFSSSDPLLNKQCTENISKLRADCEKYAMPLIVEPLVLQKEAEDRSYSIIGDLEKVIALHRQAVELGADVLKADPSDSPDKYDQVVEAVGDVPLLPRGGGRVGDREILERTRQLIQAGARGVVYGRNIFMAPDVKQMVRAISAVVHENASVDEALTV